ncbi:MAG: hypothetical protein GW903_04940 [Alphaproteobacteria bacterium]|nr:hypothetical protein [Alphaproteobacteria bacterium]NCQ88316.1 hypothetical protein [Alphaproteobacteria bacterium]NCT05177.1 hypothetical protein [Alphaproteobacteria bacterium]
MTELPTGKEDLIKYLKEQAGEIDQARVIPTREPIFTIPASGSPRTTSIQAEMSQAAQIVRDNGENPYEAFTKIIGRARAKVLIRL